MRKILLAGVATVAMTGVAAASGLEPTLGASSGALMGTAAPGKAVVRLDGYVFFSAGFTSNTLDKGPVAGGRTAKADSFGFMSAFRIFPAFDAQTAGGMRYGAFAEVRSNNNTGGTGGGIGTSGQRTTNTLFVNRAWGYIGTDALGRLQMGSVDGITSQFRTGTFEGQIADGGWNGWAPAMTRGVSPYRFFPVGGDLSQKVNYYSPIMSGFQVGLSFAPSSGTNTAGDGNNVIAGGNLRQSASTLASDFARPRNTYQLAGRYTGTFGGVGTQLHLGYIGSQAIANLNVGGVTPRGLSIVTAGATVSYMGFMVGGYMNTGAFNGGSVPLNPGEKNATVYTVGASYTTGPWVMGAAYVNANTAGALGNGAVRTDSGVAAGVAYTYAPGARMFVEFVTGSARERGVNLTNDPNSTANLGRKINATALIVANTFRW